MKRNQNPRIKIKVFEVDTNYLLRQIHRYVFWDRGGPYGRRYDRIKKAGFWRSLK